ncbi:hypothetical protein OCK74_02910 [Chitinophagaceae bacterium LB-8]|uniref:Phosphatidate cytidylyltransferase n=1 Tax=Paraflavisolibacter caeni TaxID=2982496 RepID=A0A9X2XS75_9BACT|nr:hypothetical protein [Paraflavisolibacter caeni]MCU7548044.1 hypothetical protein [Paraflavisolibacter caeni]
MNRLSYLLLLALAVSATLTSCEVVEGIFKAGFWSAIILIIVIIALIGWIVSRSRR